MLTRKIKITELVPNENNPRTLSEQKQKRLRRSILAFPQMLELRPVVADGNIVLGGNMRTLVLQQLYANGDILELTRELETISDFKRLKKLEQSKILDFWGQWLDNGLILVKDASELAESQKKQFVVKDNASFGDWDWDKLANSFETSDLIEWGLDVWDTDAAFGSGTEATTDDEESDEKSPETKAKTTQLSVKVVVNNESEFTDIRAAIEAAVAQYDCTIK